MIKVALYVCVVSCGLLSRLANAQEVANAGAYAGGFSDGGMSYVNNYPAQSNAMAMSYSSGNFDQWQPQSNGGMNYYDTNANAGAVAGSMNSYDNTQFVQNNSPIDYTQYSIPDSDSNSNSDSSDDNSGSLSKTDLIKCCSKYTLEKINNAISMMKIDLSKNKKFIANIDDACTKMVGSFDKLFYWYQGAMQSGVNYSVQWIAYFKNLMAQVKVLAKPYIETANKLLN